MADILTNTGPRWNNSTVSFLVIGSAEVCRIISEALHDYLGCRKWKISVHQAESVSDVLKSKVKIAITFILFTFDPRIIQSLINIEENIKLIDEYFITTGTACLINCADIRTIDTSIYYKLHKLQDKYKLRLLSTNVYNTQSCERLANKILNLTEAILGIGSGIPIPIGFLTEPK